MGCSASRVDNNPAVALCHDRCNLIDGALLHSFALADAHLAYSHSLSSIAPTTLRFFLNFSQASPNVPLYAASSPPPSRGGDPPPPPPPTTSAWDFLNFFEQYHMDPSTQFMDMNAAAPVAEEQLGQIEPEKVVSNAQYSAPSDDQIDVSRVMAEVQIQFEKAAKSGNQVLKLLDVGRFRYQHKNSVYQVSSKLLHAVSEVSSESMEPKLSAENIGYLLDNDDVAEVVVDSGNLSAILKQLCMWEKKLYDEVKAEEKLRTIHEKKSKQLKHLNEKGAEAAHKVDEIRTLVRTICTKRKIALQIVDQLSLTISKLRDELWPWITKLIQGLLGMWKSMMECHRCQLQLIAEVKSLDAISYDGKLNEGCLEVTVQLRFQIRNWILSFTNWIDVQRCFVKALNGWLSKCLMYEPGDGLVPSSPSRVGAPPVFVICDEWSKTIDKLSENEVVEAMEGFFTSVNQLLERYNKEVQERVVADKDMEKKLKMLDREEQKMQKILQAREKKTILVIGEKRGAPVSTSNLHLGLKHIFVAMESLAAKSVQAYDELLHVGIKDEENAKGNPLIFMDRLSLAFCNVCVI